ncbi:MAG TPA: hypothetical protein VNA69_09720 [Thermoanaerobaculia bacterium]|nr:hypothetical protein [Thermoanaerobaculia bacterium]
MKKRLSVTVVALCILVAPMSSFASLKDRSDVPAMSTRMTLMPWFLSAGGP